MKGLILSIIFVLCLSTIGFSQTGYGLFFGSPGSGTVDIGEGDQSILQDEFKDIYSDKKHIKYELTLEVKYNSIDADKAIEILRQFLKQHNGACDLKYDLRIPQDNTIEFSDGTWEFSDEDFEIITTPAIGVPNWN